MDHAARCAFVYAQAACAMAEIAAMQAQNTSVTAQTGVANPVFGFSDFLEIQNKYLIGHNSVIEYLRG